MKVEKIGEKTAKVTFNKSESKTIEDAIKSFSESFESQLLVGAVIISASDNCGIEFYKNDIGLELIKTRDGAVLYISKLPGSFTIAQRKHFTPTRINKKQLICVFKNAEELFKFVVNISSTGIRVSESRLYSDGKSYALGIIPFATKDSAVINELCIDIRNSLPDDGYKLIVREDAIKVISEL